LADLVRLSGQAAGHPRPVIALPDILGRLQALMMQWAPGPTLMSLDNFDSLSVPNVGSKDALDRLQSDLEIVPQRLSDLAPRYLQRRGSDLDAARARARRSD
jgi:NADH dehydrogenase